ncbi:unnamed protein product [Penicillium egyptiacum]|uniref:Zn(2)-C6 fungal-type domain-containing protein n=1 Tax=Penicillium egyptiacum TaxID=1303716 RepID=A0A9W4K453_9EURO|nr:unnamed protein product [Penicillium egyptiacum]
MDSDAMRHLRGPSGITKTNRRGRRPGKIACTACHARKKRCDIAPPYNQCTHCRKEEQCCIPRDSIDRYVKRKKCTDTSKTYRTVPRPIRRQMPNRNHNSRRASSNHEHQFQVNGFLSKGIDHEIPRWSAVYSFYSEIRRLLPSLTPASTSPSPSPKIEGEIAYMQTAPNERKQDTSSSGESSRRPQSDVLSRDCAEATSIKGISIPASESQSRSPVPVDKRVRFEKTLAYEAEILHGGLASAGGVRVPTGGNSGSAYDVFMNDLDALLRF